MLTLVTIGGCGKSRQETDKTGHLEFYNGLRDADAFITGRDLTFVICFGCCVTFGNRSDMFEISMFDRVDFLVFAKVIHVDECVDQRGIVIVESQRDPSI